MTHESIENRERLLTLIRDRALLRGDVKLSSGKQSDFYLDMKMIELLPQGSHLIGEVMFQEIADMDIDAIGGLAVGAVPMVTSIVDCCYRKEKDIEGFFVRDEIKKHGTMKKIEGRFPPNARVVIVDDVVTTGRSIDKALEAVREKGGEIVGIISIVDRDAGAKEHFAALGLDYRSVFTKQDVLTADAHAHV
jgi:orotate phosphoribosyltransferase